MITILTSQGKDHVVIRIEADFMIDQKLDFWRGSTSPIECALLRKHLQDRLDKAMEEIRRVSYHMGWRDAKAKKGAKRKHFMTTPNVMEWERKEAT